MKTNYWGDEDDDMEDDDDIDGGIMTPGTGGSGDVLLDATAQKLVMLNGVSKAAVYCFKMSSIMIDYSEKRFVFWSQTFLNIARFKIYNYE